MPETEPADLLREARYAELTRAERRTIASVIENIALESEAPIIRERLVRLVDELRDGNLARELNPNELWARTRVPSPYPR